ncbi:TetR/AcrR family transcriptional regulator [Phytohabitans rumicis]
MVGVTPTRRRGQELEDALLDAAWDELAAVGYARFTMEGVAARAGTSRPVIYRRWPNRAELAIAAIRHYGARQPVATPDTGSVREDMIVLLRDASASRIVLAALFSVQMGSTTRRPAGPPPTCGRSSCGAGGSRSASTRCSGVGSSVARSTRSGSPRASAAWRWT